MVAVPHMIILRDKLRQYLEQCLAYYKHLLHDAYCSCD